MNNWTRLQAVLDDLFAHGDKQTSRVTKRKQGFDEKTGETVIFIEYRVKLLNENDSSSGCNDKPDYGRIFDEIAKVRAKRHAKKDQAF